MALYMSSATHSSDSGLDRAQTEPAPQALGGVTYLSRSTRSVRHGSLSGSAHDADAVPCLDEDETSFNTPDTSAPHYDQPRRSKKVAAKTSASGLGDYSRLAQGQARQTQLDEESGAPDAGEATVAHDGPSMSPLHETFFIGSLVMAQFLSQAAFGQGLAPREIIAEGLGLTNIQDQAWFSAAYSLTAGTFILVCGRLGDIFGHKRLLSSGYAVMAIWSAFAGFSVYVKRQEFFEVCRAFQGVAAAMILPNAMALAGRAYPKGKKKNLVFALFAAMSPWGVVAGACFGSVFAQFVWWPWAFWSFAIAASGLSILSFLVVPASFDASTHSSVVPLEAQIRMDWPGSVLGVASLVLINVAWADGPLFGWGTPRAYVLLIIGVLTFIIFLWVETRVSWPLIPSGALTWTAGFTLLLIGLAWSSYGTTLYYIWRFLGELRGLLPIVVTGQLTPVLVTGPLAAVVAGLMIAHTPVSFTMMLATMAFVIGEVIITFQPVHQTYWAQIFVGTLILPFGSGLSFPAASVIISNQMPKEHQGLAASLVTTLANYSIALGLGVAGTVERYVLANSTTSMVPDNVRGIRAGLYTAVGLSGCAAVLGIAFFAFTMRKFLQLV